MTTTSPIPRWRSVEGDHPRQAEARDPRSPGRSRPELAPPARVLGRGGARGPRDRPRARARRRRPRAGRARGDVRAAAREPVDRVVRDRGRPVTEQPRPKIAVLVFPGSNDDRDAALALERLGAGAGPVWHAGSGLPDVAGVILPGGFSYGDYLRCGAIARFAPVMAAVRDFAADGGLVLGICNGFQILCEAGLLPGVLRPNASLSFVCRDVEVRVENADTPFTRRCATGDALVIPVKHGEGCYIRPDDLPQEQVVLRYAEPVNGSMDDIAG